MAEPETVNTVQALRDRIAGWRRDGVRVGLVPTMGALHAGHLFLVDEARRHSGKVIVSIFVNPTQFAPHEDFDRYPRTLEADTAKLAGHTDLIFAPSVTEMYPDGFATRIEIGGPSKGLETDFRPHFFSGVATVVAKLLVAALPDIAMFGEKDYQQLLVVKRLTADLGLPIAIVGGATQREADGLALSSRNAYLKPDERRIAGGLNVVLKDVAARLHKGGSIGDAEAAGRSGLLGVGFDTVDYVAIRDAATLDKIESLSSPARVLAAAKIGATRLIDNMAV